MIEKLQNQKNPRWTAVGSYLLYATAGAGFLFLPTTELKELLGDPGFMVWNLLLFLGSLVGALGAALRQQLIELVGLPGVFIGLGVYAAFIGSRIPVSDSPGVILGLAAVCGGAAFGALGRTVEVFRVARIKDNINTDIREEGYGNGGEGN